MVRLGRRLFATPTTGYVVHRTLCLAGSERMFENARCAVYNLNVKEHETRMVERPHMWQHVDHLLLYWGGRNGAELISGKGRWPLGASISELSGGAVTALWNPFRTATGLAAGERDEAGMLEAALVICARHVDGERWPPLLEASQSFAYLPDLADDPLASRTTMTTDIANEILLENEHVRVWRFEIEPGGHCHAHHHVYPYFFLNLLPATTRRLNVPSDDEDIVPPCPPNEAPAMKDCESGGAKSTHRHGLENVCTTSAFRQFIVEFKGGSRAERLVPRTETIRRRPASLVYLPGLHGGTSQIEPLMNCLHWAGDVVSAQDALRRHSSVEAAAEAVALQIAGAVNGSVLVGHSYGGMVALEVARRWLDHPSFALRGLVLMSTIVAAATDEARHAIAKRRDIAEREGLAAELDASWPFMTEADSVTAAAIRTTREQNAAQAGLDAFLRQLNAIDSRPDQDDTLRRLAHAGIPVLFLHGESDRLASVTEAKRAYNIMLATSPTVLPELRIFHATGHLALQERPGFVADAISAWWDRHTARTTPQSR